LEKFENENNGIEISDYEVKHKNTVGKPVSEDFDFFMENQADAIGENLYFTPLFYNARIENPFKLEERNYPIDFAFPLHERELINITIPESYRVVSLPESVSMALENNMGSFVYQISDKGTQLQVMVDLKMNVAVIPPQNYASVKEFYKKIVEKETEKVVLSKISPDEYTERTVGGR
jgi:hypothetical protein